MLFSSPLVVGPLFLQLFVHLFTISLSPNFLFPCSLHRFLFQSLCGPHIVILIRLRSSFCSTVGAHLAFSTPIFILKVIRALVPVFVEVFVLASFVHFSSRSSIRSSRFSLLLAIVGPSAFIPIFVSDEFVPNFVSLFVPDSVPVFRRSNLRSTLCLILCAGCGSNFLAGPVGSTFIAHFPDLVPNSRVTSGSSSHPHVSPIRCTFSAPVFVRRFVPVAVPVFMPVSAPFRATCRPAGLCCTLGSFLLAFPRSCAFVIHLPEPVLPCRKGISSPLP
jgi:hypothetical protein